MLVVAEHGSSIDLLRPDRRISKNATETRAQITASNESQNSPTVPSVPRFWALYFKADSNLTRHVNAMEPGLNLVVLVFFTKRQVLLDIAEKGITICLRVETGEDPPGDNIEVILREDNFYKQQLSSTPLRRPVTSLATVLF